jgi:hypothetical protein
MTKATWASLLASAGFSENDMRNWHVKFERSAPDKHEVFLRNLAIPEGEISAIRTMAATPHEILKIKKESEHLWNSFSKYTKDSPEKGQAISR